MTMKVRKCFLISGAILLIFLLLTLPLSISAKADDDPGINFEEVGGKIYVDKYRDTYELKPGEQTKVTLEVKADPVKLPKPVTAILSLDMSASMANDDSLEPTLIAARKAAEIITAYNDKTTDPNRKASIALVRYDSVASAYDFDTGKWVLLDDQRSIEDLSATSCYSSEYDDIFEALKTEKIASYRDFGTSRQINNYPRKNPFYLVTNLTGFNGTFPTAITGLKIQGYQPYLDPAIMTYGATENFRAYTSQVKQDRVHGTNMEAGIYVTELVAAKITDPNKDVYPIFMTDGVPTVFQFGGNPSQSAYTSYAAATITGFQPLGLKFATTAIQWNATFGSMAVGTLPAPLDPSMTLATDAGAKLRAKIANPNSRVQNVFAIGVNKSFAENSSTYTSAMRTAMRNAQGNILEALTGDRGSATGGANGRSFITSDPMDEIEEIYESIARTISAEPITSPITIRDEVPVGFTLTNESRAKVLEYARSLGGTADFVTNPGTGVVTIVWNLGGLVPNQPLKLSYELTANYGSYGILNTNKSATLNYETFCPEYPEFQDQDINVKPIPFPEPQIKLQPVGGQDDHYLMPDDHTPYTLSLDPVIKKNVVGIVPRAGESIMTEGMIYQNDQVPTKIDDGAEDGYDERTGTREGDIDQVPELDRYVKRLRAVVMPSQDGTIGTTEQSDIGILAMSIPDPSHPERINLNYTPNPHRDEVNGYRVTYKYRYESDEEPGVESAYFTPWYTITIDVPPKLNKASIEFKKVGDQGLPLSGAVFELYIDRGDGQAGGDPRATVTTDGAGMGYFYNLLAGKYVIKEKTAPSEYILDDTGYPVTISPEQQQSSAVVRPATYPFVNRLKTGSITFNKVDQYNRPISGVKFGLYRANDTEFAQPLQEVTTTSNGKVTFSDIKPGKYRVKEMMTPDGYENEQWISEEIEITSVNDQLNHTLEDVINFLIQKFDLEVTKIGAERDVLKGAVFKLRNDVTNYATEFGTGDDGKFMIVNLDPGIYYLKELQAPAGYRLLTSEYKLDIKLREQDVTLGGEPVDFEWVPGTATSNPVLKLTIVNKLMPELPKTGGIGSVVLLCAGSICMIVGFQNVSKINRKKEREREK